MSDSFVNWDEAVAELGEHTAERLAKQTQHRDWQGRPCWERGRFEDLLGLLDMGEPL
jgi:hypothetical protein